MNKIIKKIKQDNIIKLIKTYSKKNADTAEIYLVGGTLRDFYLNNENFDKDIIIDKVDAERFARNFAYAINATFIVLDDKNKIYRLVLPDKIHYLDIAPPIGNSIEADLKRRDLTINAIAINLKTFDILDFNNGLKDLKDKKIRQISEQNFIDDPLRLLRAYRFQATLGFDIDEDLSKIISKHVFRIHSCAIERINYELLKLLSGNFSAKTLIEMDTTGLLNEILPITQELKKIPPNLHHHLDLFNHSIETVKQIQEIYDKSTTEVKNHLKKIDFGGATRLAHLKFAGFLHDIGKPNTWTIEENTQRHRFIKHDDIGAKIGEKILKKLKFSKKQTEYITKMIKFHIYPSHVTSSSEITDKIYLRFIRKMETDVIDIIILAMADRLSARGIEITEEIVNKNISNLNSLLNFYLLVKDSLKPIPKLISGNEIMDLLNIKPSKQLGEIINTIKEAQLNGEINTKEEAVNFILSKTSK
jgi:putative nucleotidyltransferase with HDIG domain